MINVGVTGALGKMGSEVVKTVINNNEQKGEMTLVMAVDKFRTGENVFGDVVIESDLDRALEANKPDVVVDFTLPSAVFENTKKYLKAKVKPVIGTTGLTAAQIEELKRIIKRKQYRLHYCAEFCGWCCFNDDVFKDGCKIF